MNAAEFYESYWQDGKHYNPEWPVAWFQELMGVLAGCQSVLDYGCGMGYAYQRQLRQLVPRYIGADVSSLAVADAQRKQATGLLINPADGSVDLPSASVDGAVCIEVVEHLFDPLQALRELHRVLRPGGTVVVTTPNFGYHAWRLLAFLRAQVPAFPENPAVNRHNGVHIRYFSKLTFQRLLSDAGFTEIRIGKFDDGTVWDVFKAAGPLGHISNYARGHFPAFLHLHFLGRLWPGVFAIRLHAVARKGK